MAPHDTGGGIALAIVVLVGFAWGLAWMWTGDHPQDGWRVSVAADLYMLKQCAMPNGQCVVPRTP